MFFEKSVKSLIQSIERKVSENTLIKSSFRTKGSTQSSVNSLGESNSRPNSGSISPKTTESSSIRKFESLKDVKLAKTSSSIASRLTPPSTPPSKNEPNNRLTRNYVSEFTLIPTYQTPVAQKEIIDLPPPSSHYNDSDNHSANYSEISDITDTASWASSKQSFHDNQLPSFSAHQRSPKGRRDDDSVSTLDNSEDLARLKEFLGPICANSSMTHYYIILLHGANIRSVEELKQSCKQDQCFLINLGFDYIVSRDITDALLAGSSGLSCKSTESRSRWSRNSRRTKGTSIASTVKEWKDFSASDVAKLYYQIISANNREAFRDMKKLAEEENNNLAKAYLMRIYALGQAGVEQNHNMAQLLASEVFHWLKTVSLDAHSSYNVYSKYLIGVCHAEGLVVTKNIKEAFLWYKQAAEQGYDAAQAIVGHCFYTGQGVMKDLNQAVKWYRLSAQQGFAAAQCNLGICYELGEGVRRDVSEAVKWYRLAADQGNCTAQYNLGLSLECGTGIKHNQPESLKYYKKAAEQGHAGAQYKLGAYYFTESEHLELLEEEAFYWLDKSSTQGNVPALCQLGLCYERGIGTEVDMEKAIYYYRLGAEKNDAPALYHLAHCYFTGLGIEKSYKSAIQYYIRSAEKGHAPAQNNLGYCYFAGTGVTQDYSQAIKWYRLSAEHGYAQAQFNLGYCYENGYGTPKKLQETIRWYRAAAAQGHAKAESALRKLEFD